MFSYYLAWFRSIIFIPAIESLMLNCKNATRRNSYRTAADLVNTASYESSNVSQMPIYIYT